MTGKKIENIREFVWKIIDTDISLKKDLLRGIVNIRSLAKYIINTQKLNVSLDSVISAIRRYEKTPENKGEAHSVYDVLKHARISTRTNMSSLLLKRTDEVKTKLGRPDKLIDFQGHETIRVLEGSQALTLIFDRKNFENIKSLFTKAVILEENKKIGMIEIGYPRTLKKTPGVFLIVYNELAKNEISVIDSLMSSGEHIILVDEEKLLKAFEVIYELCKS
ncbi:MAG: hypothetical protein QF655_01995 [Candidatus Woesearchaeota archaeon]|nr:hypothetical protein [Candidatus Woesearchaeota archaeon]